MLPGWVLSLVWHDHVINEFCSKSAPYLHNKTIMNNYFSLQAELMIKLWKLLINVDDKTLEIVD